MRKQSLLSGILLISATTALLISEWRAQTNTSSVQNESRGQIQYRVYNSESTISELTPTLQASDSYIEKIVTPTPAMVGEREVVSIFPPDFKDTDIYIYDFSKEDIKILERITEAEATGGDIESKMNVASVIINRVNSDSFPDSIKSVVFQRTGNTYQFSPIKDNRYYEVETTKETKKAIKKILKYGVINDALYFCNPNDVKSAKNKSWFKKLTYLFTDSINHSFYKE